MNTTFPRRALLGAVVVGLVACSSGDSTDSPTVGLAVVEQVTLVDAQGAGGAPARYLPKGVLAATGTDYENDGTEQHEM